jgi:FixJ family two-component response regulator
VRVQALQAGAVDVLFKPIDEEQLVGAIEKALEARH